MLNMQIISKVVVEPITEEYIADLIRADIARQNKHVIVTKVEFEQKRNPNRVEVTVEAHLDTGEAMPVAPQMINKIEPSDAKVVETFATQAAANTEEPPFVTEAPKTEAVQATLDRLDEEPAKSVADIFAGLPKL